MRLSVVSDFDRGDLEMEYSGVCTQLDECSPTFNLEYEPRDYCSDTMKKCSNPHTINTSWATATIAAAEYLIQETLSLDYILNVFLNSWTECFQRSDSKRYY